MTLQLIKNKHIDLIEKLDDDFFQNSDKFINLMTQHCKKVDYSITSKLTNSITSLQKDIALVALGGYGREELYPFSDLDLLVICSNNQDKTALANRLVYLWQIPIRVNISYRNIDEIKNDLLSDNAFFTSLLA